MRSSLPFHSLFAAIADSFRQQDVPADLADVGMAAEGHGQVQLTSDDLQRPRHSGLTQRAQPVEIGTADHGPARTEGDGLEHVLPGTDAAVEPDLDALAHRLDDRRQRADGRGRTVQLASAMVADDQRIGAGVGGQPRVLGIEDALEHQLAAPAAFDPFDVAPVQPRVELAGGPLGQRAHVVDTLDVTDDVAETATPGAEHAQRPARQWRCSAGWPGSAAAAPRDRSSGPCGAGR